ncbi:uncharacterized protein LOC114712621 [Neltuma alba]|uniref:uncharacterized protein LOC114712621 n=1 Tax=Neltuma alba TaxID=207710 RepID=UPI0010A3CE90|nr:uncharacterized protein LOC114712621 [Prosopis alba]
MARIRPERFPKRPYKKLHARASGPFCISKKLGPNAYLLELPPDMAISPVFNVKDLVPYRGTFEPPPLCSDDSAGTSTYQAPTPPLPKVALPAPAIDAVMDEQTISTPASPISRYLVRWKGCTDADATWITEDKFRRMDPAFLDDFQLSNSPVASSSKPRRNDADFNLTN